MNHEYFRQLSGSLGLSQVELAKLLGVTPRTVNLWATGQTAIPGPVEAYLHLFASIPQAYRDTAIANTRKEQLMAKEGMYQVDFKGIDGEGTATLVFQEGKVYGADTGGGQYDGIYRLNAETGLVETTLQVTMKAGAESVLGIPPQPMDWAFPVYAQFPRNPKDAQVQVTTPHGAVNTIINYLRELPN